MPLTKEDRIRNKISKIKKALAADKKRWGGYYDDSRGLRYSPPELYLKLNDYKGAFRYFKWFEKNFPDDIGYPIFLFEWAITLFKNNKLLETEKKILETFISNVYLIDRFLGKELMHFEISESSGWEEETILENLHYTKDQDQLHDFAQWLIQFLNNERFLKIANEFIEIEKQLGIEPAGKKRNNLVHIRSHLLDDYIN